MPITQTTINDLRTYCIIPENIDSLVILLHGYGSNGMDLISLAEEWAPLCPNTAFISPDATYPGEMGGPGFQWFSLANYSRDVMKGLIQKEWLTLDKYIDAALQKFSLTDDRLILSGFSQGCMMALHTGLSRTKPCAGILGYSGMMLDTSILNKDAKDCPPVCIIHGIADSVVPVAAWDEATMILKDHGIAVSGHKTPGLAHGIDMDGLKTGLEFIRTHLS